MKGKVRAVFHTVSRGGAGCALAVAILAGRGWAQGSTPADSTAATSTANPNPGGSQSPDGVAGSYKTHTVRAGETLWELADRYLGDGDLWPSIYRLNAAIIPDPHWLYPNLVLRIPNGGAAAPDGVPPATVADAAPAAGAAAGAGAATASTTASTTPPAEASATPTETAANPESAAPPSDVTADQPTETAAGTTMFNRPPQHAPLFPIGRPGGLPGSRPLVLAPGLHYAAPYVERNGGPTHAGTVLGTSSLSNVVDQTGRTPYTLLEDIYIKMPQGVVPTVGQRLYTYSLGESFGERGQVVRPTGIIVVRQPGSAKVATLARIVQLFGNVDLGQGVLPVEPITLPTTGAQPMEGGLQTHVLYVENVLPTINYYVVLDASAKQGIHLGDQVTLYRPPVYEAEHAISLPASDIAIAQIVSVNQYGSTGIVIRQMEPDITSGASVRLSAKEP